MKSSAVSSLRWLPLLALVLPGMANAFTVDISPGSRAVYLRVGDGDFSRRSYQSNGSPIDGTSGTRNVVTAVVAPASVGNGIAQVFSANSRLTSDWDDFGFCSAGETYIGGFSRGGTGASDATLQAVVTAPLSNGTVTIPFSKISWTARGNASGGGSETAPQPVPSGAFNNGVTTLAAFPVNSWRESCHTFRYANDTVVASGDYLGTITYTLSAP